MPENQMRTQELLAQEGLESIGQKLYNNINIELSGDTPSIPLFSGLHTL